MAFIMTQCDTVSLISIGSEIHGNCQLSGHHNINVTSFNIIVIVCRSRDTHMIDVNLVCNHLTSNLDTCYILV